MTIDDTRKPLARADRAVPGRPDDRPRRRRSSTSRCRRSARTSASRETSLAWVVNAYLLTFGGFLLLGGRLGDLFGHRRLFLGGRRPVHARLARLRPRDLAGDARRRAGGAGHRRRGRLRGRALADHDAVHRAGRAREGDGRLRLRRVGRRHDRRARSAACSPTRSAGTGSSSSTSRSASRVIVLSLRLLPRRRRTPADGRLDVAGAVHRHRRR